MRVDINAVLDAFIMIEHLSEGNIKKDSNKYNFDNINNDFYNNLKIFINKYKESENNGIVIYFNIFSFNNVIKFLKEKYEYEETCQDISYDKDKFSFALYFDKDLKLRNDLIFFTASYYIIENQKIPTKDDFLIFEEEKKEELKNIFQINENEEYQVSFNKSFSQLVEKYNIILKNCKIEYLNDLENDAVNLHSFFIADLSKAKNINSLKLKKYISSLSNIDNLEKNRINLESRKSSEMFNEKEFNKILQPKNYPMGRFPIALKMKALLMQQVAINFAIKENKKYLQSVNGPPGTGKTTLLKDIFADLIVQQAYEISKLNEKHIKGTNKTIYNDKYSIGNLSEKITTKGIVIASSNNSAVKNIVDNAPIIDKLDYKYKNLDYFKELANAKLSIEWKKDSETGKNKKVYKLEEENKGLWGLFSLEGGKQQNMRKILITLDHMYNYLENDYKSNESIYKIFQTKYNEVKNYRDTMQVLYEKNNKLSDLKEEKNEIEYDNSLKIDKYYENINKLKEDISNIKFSNTNLQKTLIFLEKEKIKIKENLENFKNNKPNIFKCIFKTYEYKQYQKNIENAEIKKIDIENNILNIQEQSKQFEKQIEEKEYEIQLNKNKIKKNPLTLLKNDLADLSLEINELKNYLFIDNLDTLNFDDYNSFQLSNPYFNEIYRDLQSELFILSLDVRKQFLYENKNNLLAACYIWKENYKHKDIAWAWINLAIPVISSTFASFSKMFKDIDKEIIDYLFIDEAGQALPQASIGAIYRSKNVLAVGDPAQIKPVLTLDENILEILARIYKIPRFYLSENTSTQTLIDSSSTYGYYKNKKDWIGIPLWVHNRCDYPMFNISNKISYSNNMVQGSGEINEKNLGQVEWYNISGVAKDKFVQEQADYLREIIDNLAKTREEILDKSKDDIVYVITPFKNVANKLSEELKKINFTRYNSNKKATNIGTVHTFQGKEADIVFFILGADEKSIGAASWAVSEANIMNVAVTRAKKEFYIIGDKKLYSSLNSSVVNDTFEIINNFNEMYKKIP